MYAFGARVLPPEFHHALDLAQHARLRFALSCALFSGGDVLVYHVAEELSLDGQPLLLLRQQVVVRLLSFGYGFFQAWTSSTSARRKCHLKKNGADKFDFV